MAFYVEMVLQDLSHNFLQLYVMDLEEFKEPYGIHTKKILC
jgi:hypothetical protein